VEENLPLVKYIVRRFAGRGHEYEDLVQYGCMGLIKAIDRFDPAFDVTFSTYAVPVIMGEIRRFLRGDGPVHVARSIQDNGRRIARYLEEREQAGAGAVTVAEIARDLELTPEDVATALGARRPVRSLNEPVGEDGEQQLMDVIGRDVMERVDQRLALRQMLDGLPEEERRLILARYFLARTQTEIAKERGISQVQVSRMEARIIKKMRQGAE